jgi:hypothetical protein
MSEANNPPHPTSRQGSSPPLPFVVVSATSRYDAPDPLPTISSSKGVTMLSEWRLVDDSGLRWGMGRDTHRQSVLLVLAVQVAYDKILTGHLKQKSPPPPIPLATLVRVPRGPPACMPECRAPRTGQYSDVARGAAALRPLR